MAWRSSFTMYAGTATLDAPRNVTQFATQRESQPMAGRTGHLPDWREHWVRVSAATFHINPATPAERLARILADAKPALLITDARCYSATDIFAAGWADHGIGPILGVDDNTGAGGANVWTHELLSALMQLPTPDPDSPYRDLPQGANMRVAIRRSLRVGALAGTPVEDLGVKPDHRHLMTRDDLLGDNVDLLADAARLLGDLPVHRLGVTTTLDTDGTLTVRIEATGVDRADLFLDGRPRDSLDVGPASVTAAMSGASAGQQLRVAGYADGQLVAAQTVMI